MSLYLRWPLGSLIFNYETFIILARTIESTKEFYLLTVIFVVIGYAFTLSVCVICYFIALRYDVSTFSLDDRYKWGLLLNIYEKFLNYDM